MSSQLCPACLLLVARFLSPENSYGLVGRSHTRASGFEWPEKYDSCYLSYP